MLSDFPTKLNITGVIGCTSIHRPTLLSPLNTQLAPIGGFIPSPRWAADFLQRRDVFLRERHADGARDTPLPRNQTELLQLDDHSVDRRRGHTEVLHQVQLGRFPTMHLAVE